MKTELQSPLLTVFGSINIDIAIAVPRLPRAGETQLGGNAAVSPGGKAANQAHAARLFGVETQLFGAVGNDSFAAPALASLRAAGVGLGGVRALAGRATGMACIAVSAEGENSIVVAPGANAFAQADWVTDTTLARPGFLLLQMEVPFAQSLALARRARALGRTVMLNAAPMVDPEIPADAIDWLLFNRVELGHICAARSIYGDPIEQASLLARHHGIDVAVTLGDEGAVIAGRNGRRLTCRALKGFVFDTTGAGDTFAGVLAAALLCGQPEAQALHCAVVAASLSCRRTGAQSAQPTRSQIEAAPRVTSQTATTSPRNGHPPCVP
jgi:ribokinase